MVARRVLPSRFSYLIYESDLGFPFIRIGAGKPVVWQEALAL